MDSWSTRIKARMSALGITQDELAHGMDLTRSAITHYLAGRREPSLKQFEKLSEVLKTTPAWLIYGTTPDAAKPAAEVQPVPLLSWRQAPHPVAPVVVQTQAQLQQQALLKAPLPIMSWAQATAYTDASKLKPGEVKEFLPFFYGDKPRWYGLRVKGDAMISTDGLNRSFHEGDILIIDPDKNVMPGNFVIALLPNTDEATFKQYILDSGITYLKSMNPHYPLLAFDNKITYVCGIVVAVLSVL